MKTPDETKRAIITCMELNMECFMPGATQKALADALALIQQLEKDKDDLLEERELNDFLRDMVKQLEAERDAAVADLSQCTASHCPYCKHWDRPESAIVCINCRNGTPRCKQHFEWRGVQKEDSDAVSS